MANELCTSLRLMDKDLSGKFLQIVEEHGTSASFAVGSFMWNASRSSTRIVLLALSNSLAHYQNVSKKLGFNLKSAIDNKTAVVLEPVSTLCENFWKSGESTEVFDKHITQNCLTLFEDVKNILASMPGKKSLIIDDLSLLLTLELGLAEVITFLQCCRSLQESDRHLSIVVGTHVGKDSEDRRMLADFASHVADLRVTVSPLRTGFSANVTGTMEVVDDLERTHGVAGERRVHHFKLTDRQIKLFAPGTVGIFG